MASMSTMVPKELSFLQKNYPGTFETIQTASREHDVDLNAYLIDIDNGRVGPDQVWEMIEDLRREMVRAPFMSEPTHSESRNAFIGSTIERLEQALRLEGAMPPEKPFQPAVGRATSRLEKAYAEACAVSAATESRRALAREMGYRMGSERARLEKGVVKAARIYERSIPASIWIGVLFANSCSDLSDAFLVLARELASLQAPSIATAKDLQEIARVQEELRRHGLLKKPAPAWDRWTVLAPASMQFLANLGRSYDAWSVENPDAPAARFSHAMRPHVMVQAELHLWHLLDAAGKPTPAGLEAALHFAILERERDRAAATK